MYKFSVQNLAFYTNLWYNRRTEYYHSPLAHYLKKGLIRMSNFINSVAGFFTITNDNIHPAAEVVATAIFTALPFLFIISVTCIIASVVYRHNHGCSNTPLTISLIFSALMFLLLAGLHVLTLGIISTMIAMVIELLLIYGIFSCCLLVRK